MIEIRKAQRSNKPLKLGVKGPSGCGKTYSALRFATGLVVSGKRIVLIDTQYGQSEMYDQQFDFDVISLPSDSTGGQYREALEAVLQADGYGVVIIDTLSHDWESVIRAEDEIPPENMKSWAVAKKQTGHADFLRYLWNYPLDVICTIRCDESFEVGRDEKGRVTKRKVGLKPIQQPRIEYDFDIVFDVEPDTNIATALEFGKNHTPLWQGERFVLTEDHGKVLREWKHGGAEWKEPIRITTLNDIKRHLVALKWQKTWRDELKTAGFEVDDLAALKQEIGAQVLVHLKKTLKYQEESK